ncbi:melanocyte-stimulating hormone receptor-like [Acropora palmata]|uniref:melanocyte-stimulating hormone receptor-like n=1 Tax=Acropora palmata TaxID=6131 RepID=UPI003DA05802
MKSRQSLVDIYCSQELTHGLDNQILFLSVINTLLAITAIVGNALILVALCRETSLHLPSKVLIRNLVASDLSVGFVELVFVGYWVSILQGQWQICQYFYLTYVTGAYISLTVSLWTLAAISVDRLLALLLGLGYRRVVTLRRVYVVAIAIWVLIGLGNAITAMLNPYAATIVSVTGSIICLITALLCYTRIFFKLRHQQTRARNNPPELDNRTILLNVSRYRRTVFTALWMQSALVFCYFPYMLLAPFARPEIEKRLSSTVYFLLYLTITLLFFNSTLNPILYCWKIKEVRRIVKDMFPSS